MVKSQSSVPPRFLTGGRVNGYLFWCSIGINIGRLKATVEVVGREMVTKLKNNQFFSILGDRVD